jgi:hypothetical protein
MHWGNRLVAGTNVGARPSDTATGESSLHASEQLSNIEQTRTLGSCRLDGRHGTDDHPR